MKKVVVFLEVGLKGVISCMYREFKGEGTNGTLWLQWWFGYDHCITF
jgi:hypothetical protein